MGMSKFTPEIIEGVKIANVVEIAELAEVGEIAEVIKAIVVKIDIEKKEILRVY